MKKQIKRVVVRAPASSANLGPGFDIFGLALNSHSDEVIAERSSNKKISITVTGRYAKGVPVEPDQNTAGVVAKKIFERFGMAGLSIEVKKGIPLGIGLGGSAASAAATAVALDKLFTLNLSHNELIQMAAYGEEAVASAPHADNVAAAIMGGFTIVKSYEPLQVITLKPPKNLAICLAVPDITIPDRKTEKSRSILPKMTNLENVVSNVGNAVALALGFASGNIQHIGSSMVDKIVEPYRSSSIPGYHKVREEALKEGAHGVAISGAGPTMIALVDDQQFDPTVVAEGMKRGFNSVGLGSKSFCTKVGPGASVLDVT